VVGHRIAALSYLIVALAAAFPARAEEPAESVPPVPGDSFIEGSIADASNLVPIIASDSASRGICNLLFNGLVKYAPDLTLTGDLAERWDVEEGGLVIVFHLRRNVRWHDGAPFTAADVEFTYRAMIDPSVPTPYSGDFERVESLEVLDDSTVRVRYKEPFAPGLSSWGMSIIPKHLFEGADWRTTPLARQPVGTGPYRFKRWKTDESIELIANPDYFEHRPHIDRYVTRVIPDQATMFLELSTQQLDTGGLTPLQYVRQTDTPFFQRHYRKFRYPSFTYAYIGWNMRDPRFADRRVRQAMNLAINKDDIITGVLFGLGQPTSGPFLPSSWAYNPDVQPAAFDPEGARRLLAEAGWTDTDGDGWIDKDGRPFAFTLRTNQGNDTRQKAAEIVQRRLREVGIQVDLHIVEWSAFLKQYIDTGKFEAVLLAWSLGLDPDPFDIFHSSKRDPGEFNFVGYQNEEVDQLIEAGRREFDQERRAEIYRRIHALLAEDQPYTFLYVPDALPIVHARFRGVEVTPIGIGHNQIDWWVPPAEQRYRHWTLEP
jgi:peptide/nickel transport system substrate-binding protein